MWNDREVSTQAPVLRHLADFHVLVGAPMTVGDTGPGVRRVVPILGGHVAGPRLSGVICAGGADFQTIYPTGATDIHARYLIQAESGELIYVENSGLRTGAPGAIERLSRGEMVDPAEIYFRTIPRFEAAGGAWAWLQRSIFVATGARFPDRVELQVFEVL
jgi:hypothetical protein